MAKDLNDSVTMALIPEPKKRGRPASGKALSNAERQRRFRNAKKHRIQIDLSVEDWSEVMTMLHMKYVSDSSNKDQLVYSHIVECVYRAGFGKTRDMPDWFEENRYKGE